MRAALVLAGHGSHLDPHSSEPIWAHAAALRASCRFDQVVVALWKEEPSLSRVLDAVEADDVTVVPVFISEGYFVREVVPREMGLDGPETVRGGRNVRYTRPIGSHPLLAEVVVVRAREAGWQKGERLAVLGHGTPRNPESEANVYAQAGHVRALLGPGTPVETVFLEQEPQLSGLLATEREPVTIVPLFVADGWHVGQSIPAEFGICAAGRLRYAAAVGTHPLVAQVILELAKEARR